MQKELMEKLDSLTKQELQEIQIYIKNKLSEKNPKSWNSQISLRDAELDFELVNFLEKRGIYNMEQFIEFGLSNIPESLKEKAECSLKFFNFEPLEKKYKKTNK